MSEIGATRLATPGYVGTSAVDQHGARKVSRARDGHLGDHGNFILAGELRCGDIVARAGTRIMLEWGDVFGPWKAGPHGCELYGFIAGEGQPFSGDTTAYEALLEARGPQTISLPMPKHLPPWMLAKLGGDFNSSVTQWSSSA